MDPLPGTELHPPGEPGDPSLPGIHPVKREGAPLPAAQGLLPKVKGETPGL